MKINKIKIAMIALFSVTTLASTNIIVHADSTNAQQTATNLNNQINSNNSSNNNSDNNNNQSSSDSNNNLNNDDSNNSNSENSSIKIKLKKNTKQIAGFTALAQEAKSHLHTKYIFGGTTPSGFDCSGFTQYVYAHSLGKSIPRTAQAQYNSGIPVSENNAKAGDLVFFGSNSSSINHVGIYIGHGKMIDSQNRGVIKEGIHANWWKLVGFARM